MLISIRDIMLYYIKEFIIDFTIINLLVPMAACSLEDMP